MAATPSTMLPLGSKAPDFNLMDTRNNKMLSLQEGKSAIATVIMFLCNHCPYVKHVQPKLVELANLYQPKGISFIAISSNDVEKYPDDSPEKMQLEAQNAHYTFPYLYDESQDVAKAYKAACTPDFYVFDKDLLCVYRGCLDDSTPGNHKPLTGEHLQAALDCILAGKSVSAEQKPSIGCNIKWKA
ncbi:MAG: thioredoxin family protein [Legionella sp.]|uniref:thioredoxin family protein n=1 Tax=Legionella sp. TaxID=459 RepID=UPI002843CAFA|nr:thioredoxin family protein [Legionella sp.]